MLGLQDFVQDLVPLLDRLHHPDAVADHRVEPGQSWIDVRAEILDGIVGTVGGIGGGMCTKEVGEGSPSFGPGFRAKPKVSVVPESLTGKDFELPTSWRMPQIWNESTRK